MFKQKSIAAIALFAAVAFTSCNNEAEKKEPEKVETPPAPVVSNDSPKMNVAPATTEPVKDSMPKKDTLKKGGMKPVNTKPATPPPSGT